MFKQSLSHIYGSIWTPARCYSSKAIKNRNKLSSRVASLGKHRNTNNSNNSLNKNDDKSQTPIKKRTSSNSDPKFMVGPPNSGRFAGLKTIDTNSRIKNEQVVTKFESFDELKIDPVVRDSILNQVLGHLEYKKPSPIQTLATRAIQARRRSPEEFKSFLLAAETGSGKTIAYLGPLLSKLKEQEASDPDWPHMKDIPIVRSVIMVPTLELVSQVITIVKKICHEAKLSSFALSATTSSKSINEAFNRRIDVLVTTPDKFLSAFKKENQIRGKFKYCKSIVIDEADTLMDESFVESTQKVLSLTSPSIADLVFCSATIPKRFDRVLEDLYPETERIVSPSLHRIPRSIDFRVVEVFNPPYSNSKPLALQQALYAIHNDNTEPGNIKRVVVFLNRKDDIPDLAEMLKEKGYDAVYIKGGMELQDRKEVITQFVDPAAPLQENSTQKVRVLLTTDLLARGVDMNSIRNVILYDVPYSSIDLIHRAGRTGRMGKRGRVFLFVEKKESKAWVKGLEKVIKKGMLLA